MKLFFRTAAAVLLAMVLFIQAPTRAYAEAQNANTPDYISEVKIPTLQTDRNQSHLP